jgi:HSP20 family protein
MTDVRVFREQDESRDWGRDSSIFASRKRRAPAEQDFGQVTGRYARGRPGSTLPYAQNVMDYSPVGYELDLLGLGDLYGPFGKRWGYDYSSPRAFFLPPDVDQVTTSQIGEAGYDLGLKRTGVPEDKYRRLPDYLRVSDNPAIDDNALWRPRADILEQDTGIRVEFELPGVPREDISLTITDNSITLTALKPQTRKEETGFHFQRERHFGRFYRRLMLPYPVDRDSARAHLDHGVLKVHFARAGGNRIPIGLSETTGAETGGTAGSASS